MDTIFPKRGGSDTDSYLKDMVNQFLVEIDGAKSGKQEIFVIGATNRKETIDSAILSRLSSSFHLRLPSKESRELIFNQKFKNFKISNFDWKNEIIKKTEGYERGFFSGIFGVYDGESFDSGVMIRYIENKQGEYIYKSGGGITLDSKAELEYNELIDKIYLP